eukprot:gene38436-46714_t
MSRQRSSKRAAEDDNSRHTAKEKDSAVIRSSSVTNGNDGVSTHTHENDIEELEYEDPYGDEYDDEDLDDVGDNVDMDIDEDSARPDAETEPIEEGQDAGQRQQVWRPGVDGVAEGEELDYDPSAYVMYHAFRTEWPCLTFDFLLAALFEVFTSCLLA